ncbi:unnamed protein product [Phytophthora fragariaefolia]|uniref:Unnamed protein product n=1 Tax=Phytophthora fragariaefolia TaxID=1490495 RepID=A0A9W7CSL2_9STRA|nr:unnamed protein product [Phytophthora fragariaefolia]
MIQGDDYDGPPPKRDFRADNGSRGRFQPKGSGRAYVIQDEDSPDEDKDDREVRFQDVVEEVPNVPSAVSPAAGSTQPGSDSGKDGSQAQDISSAVFRIIENSGWRPPPNGDFRPAPRSPRFEDRNRTKFCERCNDFGHSTESCWSDLKCDRCGRKGHPARLCRVRPCSFCKKFHEDQCGEWKKFQAVKTLPRQVKLTSLLGGDPERVGLKTTPELCVLVYVGPELRSKSHDNHQCMTVISENEEYLSDLPRSDQPRLEEGCPDNNDRDDPPESRLGPGQRLCAREGLVKLPDEETVLLAGRTADHMGRGLDLVVTPKTCLYLGPGESAVVRIDYGQSNPQREVVWAGRGDRWVTQIIYAAKSWPVAVKVVNISDKTVWIDSRAAREERLAQLRWEYEPVRTPEYQWPKKLLVRSPAGSAQVHMVRLQPRPNVGKEKSPARTDVQLSATEISGTSDSEGTESREAKLIEGTGGSHEDFGNSGEILEDRSPVVVLDEDSDSGDEAFYDAISFAVTMGTKILRKLSKRNHQLGRAQTGSYFRSEGSRRTCRSTSALHLVIKVYELLKKLLETGLIEHSGSPWASPIVIVLKKNRMDIRMCIDYRVVNGFIQLSNYSLPLIDDLLIGFESAMWFMSLDMVSGFWAIRMTERAKLISAFVWPFGHFQWVRMPFGLKNAPLVYQAVINNCLWGFVRLSPEEEAEIDQDALEFLGLDPSKREESGSQVSALTDTVTIYPKEYPSSGQHGSGPGTVQDLPFPKTLKGVQSFLGSLNYYHKFIEDFPVVAAVLYELSDDLVRSKRDLTSAKAAFEILKKKIVSTPLLRHPDRSKPFVIIPHANRWAACEVLGQEQDGKIQPVRFMGRVLNDAELRYHVAEEEVIAVLRVLQVFRTLLEGCRLEVYTRHSVFKWILQSKTADGRCVPWGVILSHWDITVRKIQRDEDGLAAIMGAGITPREYLDEVAESLIPAKGRVRKPPVLSVEMLDGTYQGIALSFDGAAKTSTRRGSCGCILWQLPGGKVLEARGFILDDVSVNDAEYNNLLKGVQMALDRQVENLVVVGDSRIVIQQVQSLINCHQPNLQKHLAECEVQKEKFRKLHFVHVKREYNPAADYLTSETLTLGKSWIVQDPDEFLHLERVSKIAEKLMKPKVVLLDGELPQNSERQSLPKGGVGDVADSQSAPLPQAARVFAVLTRSKTQPRTLPSPEVIEDAPPDEEEPRRPMTHLEYQAERWRRIRVHQEQDTYLSEIKTFLKGDIERFSPRTLRKISKVAALFALDARDVLYRLARSTRGRPRDFVDEPRLVIPDALRSDMLHYAHEDFQGGHQGITRTYEKLRSEFYWPGMYADVEHYPRRPFEVVSMDFVTHMPESERGNTFLLLFQDAFSGFVMCKPMRSTTAQDVAEVYEECVFRRFGASSMVRHDQDPRFMSEVFTRFREFLGSKQRATLAYRPQANGQQERSVQTVVRSIRAYIAEADQSDWDEHAERLMFALNTSFDATRLDTPFYLVHGWDAQGTLSAMLGPKPLVFRNARPSSGAERCNGNTAMRSPVQKISRRRPSVNVRRFRRRSGKNCPKG